MRILVVEDDDDSAALLVCLFEREGWSVDTASCVREARKALSAIEYGVLVTDFNLPDGTALHLLASAPRHHLRVAVLVTGAIDDRERRESEAAGFQKCLSKPLSGKDIVDTIRTLTRSAEARG